MERSQVRGKIIAENYHKVIQRIQEAARLAGRDPQSIRLVVVTKTQTMDVIKAVIEAGATDLGENYVEEALPKIQSLASPPGLNWHMIGHIQSRKAQDVCEYFQFVHSLDSVKLAARLSRFANKYQKALPVWIEFNVSGEETKSGWNIAKKENWKNILVDLAEIFTFPNLIFFGAMTVPAYSHNPEDSRPYYQILKEFQNTVTSQLKVDGFEGLSMGMSGDFEVAIQEGSTCVRIGQAILGPRSK